MKWTFKRFIFVVLELIFTAVVPLVIVYLGYGGWGAKAKRFKIYFRVVVAAVVVFLIVKRVFINPWLDQGGKPGGADRDGERRGEDSQHRGSPASGADY